jgi:putative DNA-invertase from lambdoid prophage Rac
MTLSNKSESENHIKVALYARVSSRESQDRQDPENQLRLLRRRAEWDEVVIYEEYVDYASGADPNRPALAKLNRDMRAMRFRKVYVVRLDRITRSLRNLLNLIEAFDKRGVGLVCTEQDIRTDTSTGKLMINFLGAIAEFERDLISERTKEGLARAASEGRFPGRIPLEVHMETAQKFRDEGWSYAKIAEYFGVSKATICRRFKKEV